MWAYNNNKKNGPGPGTLVRLKYSNHDCRINQKHYFTVCFFSPKKLNGVR